MNLLFNLEKYPNFSSLIILPTLSSVRSVHSSSIRQEYTKIRLGENHSKRNFAWLLEGEKNPIVFAHTTKKQSVLGGCRGTLYNCAYSTLSPSCRNQLWRHCPCSERLGFVVWNGRWRTVLLRSQHKVHRRGRTYVLPSPMECSFPGGSIRHRVWPLKLPPAPTGIYKPDCRNFRNYCLCHTTSEIIQQIGLSRKSLACAWLSLKTEADCSQQLLGIYTAWGSLITSHAGQRIKMLPYYRSVINTRWFNSIHLTLLCSSHTFTCYWHHPGRWPASLG